MKMKKTYLLIAVMAFVSNTAVAQKWGATPQDSIDCIMNYSVWNELHKQNNFKESYEPWKKMMSVCPARHVNDYIKGRTILKVMIDDAKTPVYKTKYINELIALSDQRTVYFGDEANNIAQKARDISDYYPEKIEEIYNLYKQAAEKGGDNLDARYAPLYLQSTLQYIKGTGDTANLGLLFDVYDYVSELCDNALISTEEDIEKAEADKKSTANLNKEKANIQSYAVMCENYIEPYASCERILPMYQSKYDANMQDLNLLKKITTTLERKGCTNSPLFFSATESLHQIEPSAKTAYMMGKMLFEKKQYVEAVKYFENAMTLYKDNISKAKAAQALANAYNEAGQYANARTAANKWGELDKTAEGKAALFVARLYLSSSVSCASHEGKIRGAAWVAYDEAARIKNNYPELADEAQRIMNSAYGQFPAKKDVFFIGLTEGQGFSVGCWIGKSTIIRGR
jgi:tetratricopeptide (TPR) repeat protein